ncbi:hypothetical protein [Aestuariibacter sp. A3R04]|uniref:hypothetical protein n=1 Tax=Aestuariibacter sp. A3R04 TaxID=2841571 RepID=UPI001C08965A|nr:hypothetical protein [Aestuariibacter sp. A3R04]MBU3020552.1 hypothetical protein [Aestuariibacter sp. A3R04]
MPSVTAALPASHIFDEYRELSIFTRNLSLFSRIRAKFDPMLSNRQRRNKTPYSSIRSGISCCDKLDF